MAAYYEITKELIEAFANNCDAYNEMADFYHRDDRLKSSDRDAIKNAIEEADIMFHAIASASITYKKRIDEASIRVRIMKNAKVECSKAECALKCALIDVLDIN